MGVSGLVHVVRCPSSPVLGCPDVDVRAAVLVAPVTGRTLELLFSDPLLEEPLLVEFPAEGIAIVIGLKVVLGPMTVGKE